MYYLFFFTYLQKASNWYWHYNNLALLRKYFNHFKRVGRYLFLWWPADNQGNRVFNRLNWLTAKLHTTIITLNIFFSSGRNQRQTEQCRDLISWRINNTWVFLIVHYWRKSVFMCMFGETRARCSNGFEGNERCVSNTKFVISQDFENALISEISQVIQVIYI